MFNLFAKRESVSAAYCLHRSATKVIKKHFDACSATCAGIPLIVMYDKNVDPEFQKATNCLRRLDWLLLPEIISRPRYYIKMLSQRFRTLAGIPKNTWLLSLD